MIPTHSMHFAHDCRVIQYLLYFSIANIINVVNTKCLLFADDVKIFNRFFGILCLTVTFSFTSYGLSKILVWF